MKIRFFCLLYKLIYLGFQMETIAHNIRETKFTAIIVEPRLHPALSFVLENVGTLLPAQNWSILVFHGSMNTNFVKETIISIEKSIPGFLQRLQMINLNVSHITIHSLNNLLLSKSFYEIIPTEMFLIFQTDSMICERDRHIIYEFMEYDYVGAPWNHPPWLVYL